MRPLAFVAVAAMLVAACSGAVPPATTGPGATVPTDSTAAVSTEPVDPPCSRAELEQARQASPSATIGDDGVVRAHLDGLGDVLHPQAAMLFVTNTLKQGDVDPGTDCVLRATGRWLVDSLTQEGDVWYWFYGFDWAYGDDDRLLSRAPWPSGLAQGNGLVALGMLADYTGDAAFDEAAHRAFSAFSNAGSRIRTDLGDGGLWFQEYETAIPTFVLNGNLDALIGVGWYADRYADSEAHNIFRSGIHGLHDLLPLFTVPGPHGEMSAYDLVRLHPDLRLAVGDPAGEVEVSSQDGGYESTARVEPHADTAANLIDNGGFQEVDAAGWPKGWSALITAGGDSFAFPADGDAAQGTRYARITTSGAGWEVLAQTISKVPAGRYVLSASARAPRPLVVPGRMTVVSECPGERKVVAEKFQIRAADWAPYGVEFDLERDGCDLLIELYQFSSTVAGGRIDFDDVALRSVPDTAVVTLPFSVYDHPDISVSVTGTVYALYEGTWVALPGGALPMYLQGRNIHYGYHDGHVRQLRTLVAMSGDDQVLRSYADRWEAMVPQS